MGTVNKILPETGRGTNRRMVGGRAARTHGLQHVPLGWNVPPVPLLPRASRCGPPLLSGEDV